MSASSEVRFIQKLGKNELKMVIMSNYAIIFPMILANTLLLTAKTVVAYVDL